MYLSEEIIKKINNLNSKLAKQLVEIINKNKILTIEELQNYENKIFIINGKTLTEQEKIDYCIKLYENYPFEYEDLTFEECKLERKYYNELNTDIPNKQKIINLIKLFSLTGREIYFLTEAYNLIINNKL